MLSFLWLCLYDCLRPFIKWFLRRTTGLCELQRMCYGEVNGAPRIRAIEYSLNRSRSNQIRRLRCHLNDVCDNRRFVGSNQRELIRGAVDTVLLVKGIDPRVHVQFTKSFARCVEQIWGYRQLQAEIEQLRRTPYDAEDVVHETKLLELWRRLMPDEPLTSRISKQWQAIGFQGDDPRTDFRGMGLLGLENLLYFAAEYNAVATHVLSRSCHPVHGYTYAIVGINLTCVAWQLFRDGDAKTYVYDASKSGGPPTIRLFHQFYSYLFYEFDRYWTESKPRDIMEFASVKERFVRNVRASLQESNTSFRINLSVDTV